MEGDLFCSASQMAQADNYNDWTFSLFQGYVRGTVLEVGCGVGSLTSRVVAGCAFDRLVSIDISPEAVEYCRQNLRNAAVEFRCADVREVTGNFDAIICMNVLEHIEDDIAALSRMLDMLTPGGVLFLLVPAHGFLFSPFDQEGGHFRRYSKQSMRRRIEAASRAKRFRCHQFYFNSIGALGYFAVYRILRKVPREGAAEEINFFDSCIVPVLRRIEGRHTPFGISLVSVITREAE